MQAVQEANSRWYDIPDVGLVFGPGAILNISDTVYNSTPVQSALTDGDIVDADSVEAPAAAAIPHQFTNEFPVTIRSGATATELKLQFTESLGGFEDSAGNLHTAGDTFLTWTVEFIDDSGNYLVWRGVRGADPGDGSVSLTLNDDSDTFRPFESYPNSLGSGGSDYDLTDATEDDFLVTPERGLQPLRWHSSHQLVGGRMDNLDSLGDYVVDIQGYDPVYHASFVSTYNGARASGLRSVAMGLLAYTAGDTFLGLATAIGTYVAAKYAYSAAIGALCLTRGVASAAIGSACEIGTGSDYSAAIGSSSRVGNGFSQAAAIGWDANVQGENGVAIGSMVDAMTDDAAAVGIGARCEVGDTMTLMPVVGNLRGNITIGGVSDWSHSSGVQVSVIGKSFDVSGLNSSTLTLPSGMTFYPTEVGLIWSSGTISSVPTVEFGITGDTDKHASAAAMSDLTAVRNRHRVTSLSNAEDGVTSLVATVTVAATGTLPRCRPYWIGMYVQDDT